MESLLHYYYDRVSLAKHLRMQVFFLLEVCLHLFVQCYHQDRFFGDIIEFDSNRLFKISNLF